MKKKTCSLVVAALALSCLASCNSGPKRLARSFDGWVNDQYSQDSIVHGLLLQDILPVYPFVSFVATIGDVLIVNPYYFWSKDVWEGTGTAYTYAQAGAAERSVAGSGL